MGNKCYASNKSNKTPAISTLKTYLIPQKDFPMKNVLQKGEKPQPLKFIAEIDKIKCKNLTLVVFFLKKTYNL